MKQSKTYLLSRSRTLRASNCQEDSQIKRPTYGNTLFDLIAKAVAFPRDGKRATGYGVHIKSI